MIPEFNSLGLLPEGIHTTTWQHFCTRYGTGPKRKALLENIKEVILILKQVECQYFYIDGSFVTNKRRPDDFDACWDPTGVNKKLFGEIAPELKNYPRPFSKLVDCKQKYKGDVYIATLTFNESPNISCLQFFQVDKQTKEKKGIIKLDLQTIML